MDLPFPPGTPPGTAHPAPAEEQARLHRLLLAHRPPLAPFGRALPPGSFNGRLARQIGTAGEGAVGTVVKAPFTFAF